MKYNDLSYKLLFSSVLVFAIAKTNYSVSFEYEPHKLNLLDAWKKMQLEILNRFYMQYFRLHMQSVQTS